MEQSSYQPTRGSGRGNPGPIEHQMRLQFNRVMSMLAGFANDATSQDVTRTGCDDAGDCKAGYAERMQLVISLQRRRRRESRRTYRDVAKWLTGTRVSALRLVTRMFSHELPWAIGPSLSRALPALVDYVPATPLLGETR